MVLGFEGEHPLQVLQGQVVETVNAKNKSVELVTNDGVHYNCDAAMITVPLGVLKTDYIKFTPPLPKEKLDAINSIGDFGVSKDSVINSKLIQHNLFDYQLNYLFWVVRKSF